MREKYESLPLTELKALAKVRGLRGISGVKKAELVELMLAEDEKDNTVSAGSDRAAEADDAQERAEAPVREQGSGVRNNGRQENASRPADNGRNDTRSRQDAPSRQDFHGKSDRPGRQEPAARTAYKGRNEGAGRQDAAREDGRGREDVSARPETGGRGDNYNRSDAPARPETGGRGDNYNRSEAPARPETGGRGDNYNRSEAPVRPETGGRGDNYNRSDAPARPEAGGRGDNYNRSEAPTRPEAGGRGDSYNRSDAPARQEPATRAETYVRNEAASRPDTFSRGDGVSYRQDGDRRGSYRVQEAYDESQYPKELDSGMEASGILEVMPDGYGFIRCENYLPGENDVYVAPSQIRRFGLKTGDILRGNKRVKTQQEKFSALLFIRSINGYTLEEASKRKAFEDMTPIFPNQRIRLETPGCCVAMRVMDLVSPVGRGQRGMIVSPPKAGKTTLLKEVAKSILRTNPQMHMLILLIDERPEEVTDIREAIVGDNVEVIYSTFDELPEHHKRVSEMVIERAKRLVEHKKDVVILLDSITRLTRAYNQVVPPSGRTLSGGLDPSALHMPKRFFGAARNMREGGSLTILATALVDTGSKMDDVVYEEFKGTGNMEMVLDRRLSEKRIFPAIDLQKSGTRREDLLLTPDELEAINVMRKALNGMKADDAADRILDMFARTRTNNDFVNLVKKNKFI